MSPNGSCIHRTGARAGQPPSPTDPENWKRLMNFLYLHEQDDLFRWAKAVRATVEEAEKAAAA